MTSRFAREPAVIVGAVEAVALALLGLAIILFDIESDTAGAMVAIVAPVIALLTSLFTRSKVVPAP